MSGEIKVGDVCEIVRTCCFRGAPFVGRECSVEYLEMGVGRRCHSCGYDTPGGSLCCRIVGESYEPCEMHLIPREFLRKSPPKSDDQGEPRTDFVPAEPEFVEDLARRLNKTTEPA